MSDPVLFVIDMQPTFSTSEAILENVMVQVNKFVSRAWPIVLVEYEGFGASYKSIYRAVDGHRRLFCVQKRGDNGSHEILRMTEHTGLNLSNGVVCGVNTCCCVRLTVLGLLMKNSHIKDMRLQKDALNCGCGHLWASMYGEDCDAALEDEIVSLMECKERAKIDHEPARIC